MAAKILNLKSLIFMISFSSYSKRRGATLAGVFSVALCSLFLLCGAARTPTGALLVSDVNANGYSLTNAATVSATNLIASGSLTAPASFTIPYSQVTGRPTLGSLAALAPTGTASSSTYLRGDASWAVLPADYTLPVATTTTLGGVIVPTSGGLAVDGSGNLSIAAVPWSTVTGAPAFITSSGAPVQSVAGRTGTITLSASDISGLAASATTDTTNASNITSGTLAAARVATLNQNTTGSAGSVPLSGITLTGIGFITGAGHQVNLPSGFVTLDSSGNITLPYATITATSFTGSGAALTALPTTTSLYPTLNQNTTGSAGSFTGSLAGDVTGTQGATTVGKINGTTIPSANSTALSKAIGSPGAFDLLSVPNPAQVNIIWLDDFVGDQDGAEAGSILCQFARMGSANIVGVICDVKSATGAPAMSYTLNYFGFGNVPIGAYQGSVSYIGGSGVGVNMITYPSPNPVTQVPGNNGVLYGNNSTTLLRKILAAQPNYASGNIPLVIVETGSASAMNGFYNSAADSISTLTGAQLIAAKCRPSHGVVVGGGVINSNAVVDYNFSLDPNGSQVWSSIAGTTSGQVDFIPYEGTPLTSLATTNTSTTVTVASTTGLVAGQYVTDSAGFIPANATISSITDSTHFVISAAATGAHSGGTGSAGMLAYAQSTAFLNQQPSNSPCWTSNQGALTNPGTYDTIAMLYAVLGGTSGASQYFTTSTGAMSINSSSGSATWNSAGSGQNLVNFGSASTPASIMALSQNLINAYNSGFLSPNLPLNLTVTSSLTQPTLSFTDQSTYGGYPLNDGLYYPNLPNNKTRNFSVGFNSGAFNAAGIEFTGAGGVGSTSNFCGFGFPYYASASNPCLRHRRCDVAGRYSGAKLQPDCDADDGEREQLRDGDFLGTVPRVQLQKSCDLLQRAVRDGELHVSQCLYEGSGGADDLGPGGFSGHLAKYDGGDRDGSAHDGAADRRGLLKQVLFPIQH
jgi:hypothetical protein